MHTNVRFKRNKAKAPNPLSCKPKKQKAGEEAGRKRTAEEADGGDGETERQRKRTRKRRRGAKAAGGAGGGGGDAGAGEMSGGDDGGSD